MKNIEIKNSDDRGRSPSLKKLGNAVGNNYPMLFALAFSVIGGGAMVCNAVSNKEKPFIESKINFTDEELNRRVACVRERLGQLCLKEKMDTGWMADNCKDYMVAYPVMDTLEKTLPFREALLREDGLNGLLKWTCEGQDTPDPKVLETVDTGMIDKLSPAQADKFTFVEPSHSENR